MRTLITSLVALTVFLGPHAGSIAAARPESTRVEAPPASPERMTRERYDSYVKLFNARDPRFVEYYDENIVFDHGPVYGILRGRQAVLDFYRTFWAKIDEEIVPGRIAIDNEHGIMLVELSTRLRAKEDGVQLPSRRLERRGDLLVIREPIAYGIADGLITTIDGLDLGKTFSPAPAVQPEGSSALPAPFPSQLTTITPQLRAELEKSFRQYVDCFNRQDFACFMNFYAQDLVYESPRWTLRNKAEFQAFYVKAWKHLTEHLTIKSLEFRPNQIVATLSNQLDVFADFPDFAAGPRKKGDRYVVSGTVTYTLRDGRIARIGDD